MEIPQSVRSLFWYLNNPSASFSQPLLIHPMLLPLSSLRCSGLGTVSCGLGRYWQMEGVSIGKSILSSQLQISHLVS